jgi:limonene-1,2-epoxide hydrolase
MNDRPCRGQTAHMVVLLAIAGLLVFSSPAFAVDAGRWVKDMESSFNSAMKSGDIASLAAGWTEDSVRIHPFAGEVRGRDGQSKLLQSFYDGWKDQVLKVHNYFAKGNLIAVQWSWTGTQRESGKTVTLDEFVLFDLDNEGMVRWARQYFDTAQFIKQLE